MRLSRAYISCGNPGFHITLDWHGRFEYTSASDPNEMAKIHTTEQRIALIAQGSLDSQDAPQLLDDIFGADDHLTVLRDFSVKQQYIDGLYEVHYFYLCRDHPHGTPKRFLVTLLLIRQRINCAFKYSGRRQGKLDWFQPITMSHSHSRGKMRCRTRPAAPRTFGKRMTQPVPPSRLRSFV